MYPYKAVDVVSVISKIKSELVDAYVQRTGLDVRRAVRHYEHYDRSVLVLHPIRVTVYVLLWLAMTLLGTRTLMVHTRNPFQPDSWAEWLILFMIAGLFCVLPLILGIGSLMSKDFKKQSEHKRVIETFLANIGYPDQIWCNEEMIREAVREGVRVLLQAQSRLRNACEHYCGNATEIASLAHSVLKADIELHRLTHRARMFIDIELGSLFAEMQKGMKATK